MFMRRNNVNLMALRTTHMFVLLFITITFQAVAAADTVWDAGLRAYFFGERPIVESEEVISLEAPVRAEDAAIVPIKIKASIPQTEQHFIKTITLVIDKNPVPLVGKFHFSSRSGRADLALRIRVNEYSPVRAIAETSDGRLTMSTRFVKASGGCSAPVGTDLEAAMARLGKMRFKTKGAKSLGQPLQTQLGISHPNVTGMQMDQLTRLYAPAHFVKRVNVSFEGEQVFAAETDISVSENPNFRFYFVPQKAGLLRADVLDSNGMRFNKTYFVKPNASAGQ